MNELYRKHSSTLNIIILGVVNALVFLFSTLYPSHASDIQFLSLLVFAVLIVVELYIRFTLARIAPAPEAAATKSK